MCKNPFCACYAQQGPEGGGKGSGKILENRAVFDVFVVDIMNQAAFEWNEDFEVDVIHTIDSLVATLNGCLK
jgi:hypothetical protein